MKRLADAFHDPLPRTVLARHRAELRSIALETGARDVLLFGSTARMEDRPGSDLDLLLVDPPADLGGFHLVAIEHRLRQLAGIPVQLLTAADLAPAIRARVLEEAQPL